MESYLNYAYDEVVAAHDRLHKLVRAFPMPFPGSPLGLDETDWTLLAAQFPDCAVGSIGSFPELVDWAAQVQALHVDAATREAAVALLGALNRYWMFVYALPAFRKQLRAPKWMVPLLRGLCPDVQVQLRCGLELTVKSHGGPPIGAPTLPTLAVHSMCSKVLGLQLQRVVDKL